MLSKEQVLFIERTLAPFEPNYIGVFGSRARGDHKVDSDLDLLVDFKKKLHLLDVISLEMELKNYFGFPVQLVFRRSISSAIKPYILEDLKPVFCQ